MTERSMIVTLCAIAAGALVFVTGFTLGSRNKTEGLVLLSAPSVGEVPSEAVASSDQAVPSSAPQPDDDVTVTPLDLNTATVEELCELPGVGKTTAEKIIEYREENGGFYQKEELLHIKGIGEKTYAKLESQVTVEP